MSVVTDEQAAAAQAALTNRAASLASLEAQLRDSTAVARDVAEAKAIDKPVVYIPTQEGIFELRQNAIGTFLVKQPQARGLIKLAEGMDFKLPKIPWNFYFATMKFFREVAVKKNNAEAMVQIYWNKTAEHYEMYCPPQTVSGGSVKFERIIELDQNPDYILVMDIHSHNVMGAFFSGIDTADEKETRLFGVAGKVRDVNPDFKMRFACGGQHVEVAMWDIFENPLDSITFPEEWTEICKAATVNAHAPVQVAGPTTGGVAATGSHRSTVYGIDDVEPGDLHEHSDALPHRGSEEVGPYLQSGNAYQPPLNGVAADSELLSRMTSEDNPPEIVRQKFVAVSAGIFINPEVADSLQPELKKKFDEAVALIEKEKAEAAQKLLIAAAEAAKPTTEIVISHLDIN